MHMTSGGSADRSYSDCWGAALLEQDLLGLLTAAVGGLSGPDLARADRDPAVGDRGDPAHHCGPDVRPAAQPLGAYQRAGGVPAGP